MWSYWKIIVVLYVFLIVISFGNICSAKEIIFSKKFEINSEAVTLKNHDGFQFDLKALMGLKIEPFKNVHSRWSVGGRSYIQDSKKVGSSRRTGYVLQVLQNLWGENVFLMGELFTYKEPVNSISTVAKKETKWGIFGSYYSHINSFVSFDAYGEIFNIREISKQDMLTDIRTFENILSVARVGFLFDSSIVDSKNTLGWSRKVSGLLEFYHKDAPEIWGSSYTDLRLGLRAQPWHFISAKLFVPIYSTRQGSPPALEVQLNVYLLGGDK
ncbi:MAG: hypothetical protein H6625_04320 [Bdellovibrionaceae bacterium]|nr:hypothetical protein [Pseudobdellovibrionaceae bacterium]